MEYKLVMDQQLIDEYNKYYFKTHPRARKLAIEKPRHPSINVWAILPRKQMNILKQKWKDFGIWWMKKLGYDGLMLDKVKVDIIVYMPSRRRADIDNNCCEKFLWDAFTEAGFWVDDDYLHVTEITSRMGYDKENPRTEIRVVSIDNGGD